MVELTLVASLSLLLLDHHFQVLSLVFVLSALLFESVPGRRFVLLRLHGVCSRLGRGGYLGFLDHLRLCLLESAIHCCTHSYIHLRLLLPRLFSLVDLNVPLALGDDLICSFPGLVNLLDHLLTIEVLAKFK